MLRQQIVAVRLFSTKPTAKPKNPNFGTFQSVKTATKQPAASLSHPSCSLLLFERHTSVCME